MKFISFLTLGILCASVSLPMSAQGRSEKRGLCFNNLSNADIELLKGSTSWVYNWGNRLAGDATQLYASEIEYLPMIWSAPKDGSSMSEAAVLEILDRNPNCKYMLGFNEPNLSDQADMTPQEAANSWGNIVSACRKRGVKIVSPAMNWGTKPGYNDAIKWFDEFFGIVGLESVDYIAYHAYMPSASAVMNDISRLKKYGKPIWLTEFCAASGSITNDVATQKRFLVSMLVALEKDPDVFRYAWFKERGTGNWSAISILNRIGNTASYTDLGKLYAAIPTFNPDFYHQVNEEFPATQFIEWSNGVSMDVATGTSQEVVLIDLGDSRNQSITYQVETPQAGNYDIAFTVAGGSTCAFDKITLGDGTELCGKTSMGTGGIGIWKTISVPVRLPSGKNQIMVYPTYGRSFKLAAIKVNCNTAIDDVVGDKACPYFEIVGNSIVSDGDVRVYNMQGVEVGCDNLSEGIYIVTTPSGSVKIRI